MSDIQEQAEFKGALTAEDTSRLSEHVAGLVNAGLPLAPGLRALAQEIPRGPLRTSLAQLADALERGDSLDEAVEAQKGQIPAHFRGLVLGGIRSGRLGDVLSRFTGYMSIGTELKRKLWLSLAYPMLSIAVALALFLFVHLVLVTMFEAIFLDFGIPLPQITMAMLILSRFLRAAWPVLLIASGILVFGWIGFKLGLSQPVRRSMATKLPITGGVWRSISLAEFAHLLALLLESRLSLPEALRLTGEGVQNRDLDRACQEMATAVEQGTPLALAMASRSELPSGLPRLLRWASDRNAIAEILHMAGEMFEARARGQATFAGTVMAVLSAFVVLWGVFTVVFGLMLPIITLISRLSG
jgi:general secretion pathway protein F